MTNKSSHNGEPGTVRQELRSLSWIVKRVLRLSPAGKTWLMSFLQDELGLRPKRCSCCGYSPCLWDLPEGTHARLTALSAADFEGTSRTHAGARSGQ